MPRIDPAQLLKTLSVLLGPNGGIKSTEEVISINQCRLGFDGSLTAGIITRIQIASD
jgi:hypothetical protein